MATLKMAERQKAFGFSYASLVGAVPSNGRADSTRPWTATEENDPSGAIRNGYALSMLLSASLG
jgi:hypothetical protein